jgi:hypothetical protein
MVAISHVLWIASFLFIIIFSLANKLKQVFSFLSVQAQGTKVENSLCVELKKVKLEMILKVELTKYLCVMFKRRHATKIGTRQKKLERGFFCVMFS